MEGRVACAIPTLARDSSARRRRWCRRNEGDRPEDGVTAGEAGTHGRARNLQPNWITERVDRTLSPWRRAGWGDTGKAGLRQEYLATWLGRPHVSQNRRYELGVVLSPRPDAATKAFQTASASSAIACKAAGDVDVRQLGGSLHELEPLPGVVRDLLAGGRPVLGEPCRSISRCGLPAWHEVAC